MLSLQSIEDRSLAENHEILSEFRKEKHISFSAVSAYLRCPRQYKYKYVQFEKPAFTPDALLFGKAFHRTVAGFYTWLKDQGELLPLKQLLVDWEVTFDTVIQEAVQPIRFKKPASELAELGRQMLSVFHEQVKPRDILAIELPFSIEIPDPRTGEILPPRLVGSIDLLEADADGSLIVSDLKTAAKRWSDRDADLSLQASVYAYVLSQLTQNRPDDVLIRFDIVTKARKPAFQQLYTTRNSNDHQRILCLIADVLRAVDSRCFHVNPSWMCNGCQFQEVCDADA